MTRLGKWWRRMLGREEPPHAPAPPAKHAAKPQPPKAPADSLELVDAPSGRNPGRGGVVGFDPYGNDAGFAKPHGWERVDHD